MGFRQGALSKAGKRTCKARFSSCSSASQRSGSLRCPATQHPITTMQAKLICDTTLDALQRCLDVGEFADVVAMQAIMNSLEISPEDFFACSTTFSERCLDHFSRVYESTPKRAALALCRLQACQEYDTTPRKGFLLIDPAAALRPVLARHEKSSREAFELTQLRRSTHSNLGGIR